MERKSIYKDEYLELFEYSGGVYLETFKKGYSIEGFNSILENQPNIEITSFTVMKTAILDAPLPPQKIGGFKERIIIEITDHALKAFIIFNLVKEELDLTNREALVRETAARLREKGIVYGINRDLFTRELSGGRRYLIAEGMPAVNGQDCIITMYELQDARPIIQGDGKADFYDLRLINRVNTGDWLGERLEATEGIPGRTVKGEVLTPEKGKNIALNYDKKSVAEVHSEGKTTLYSKINGAVSYSDGRITVANYLEITGDVNFSIGNIDFDGYLTIKGTVLDGFSVVASKDIEINGDLGLGNVKEIISTGGSIFIRGGIAAKTRPLVKAASDIFVKFADNVELVSGKNVYIGFYCINSTVTAREVIVGSSRGRIIGGSITAEARVSVPIIGSNVEKKTIVEVKGFDRKQILDDLDEATEKAGALKSEQALLKSRISGMGDSKKLNPFQLKEYNQLIERMLQVKDELKETEENKKALSAYLRIRGEGEIVISKKVYRNSLLILKDTVIEVGSNMLSVSYFIQDGKVKELN